MHKYKLRKGSQDDVIDASLIKQIVKSENNVTYELECGRTEIVRLAFHTMYAPRESESFLAYHKGVKCVYSKKFIQQKCIRVE